MHPAAEPLERRDLLSGVPELAADVNQFESLLRPHNLVKVGDSVFFATLDATDGRRLWMSDGTPEGTVVVGAFRSFAREETERLSQLVLPVGDTLYFVADDGLHGEELWKTDGTAAGTVMIRDIHPGAEGAGFGNFMVDVNGTLFFSADDGVFSGLWKSDGTEAGTVMVKEIWPITGRNPNFNPMVAASDTLFFSATNAAGLPTLYTSDGTSAGTVAVRSFDNGGETNYTTQIQELTNVQGTVFFRAYTVEAGQQLYRSDGMAEGTVAYDVTFPTVHAIGSCGMVSHRGALYFNAFDEATGSELWKLAPTPGDTDFDGDVDIDDLNHVRNHFGQSGPGIRGDINGDEIVDAGDLTAVRNHFDGGLPEELPAASGATVIDSKAPRHSANESKAQRPATSPATRPSRVAASWRSSGARRDTHISRAAVWDHAVGELLRDDDLFSSRLRQKHRRAVR